MREVANDLMEHFGIPRVAFGVDGDGTPQVAVVFLCFQKFLL